MYQHIPKELKALPQWVCWKGVPDATRSGHLKKIPINPRTGAGAQSNNPATWSDYETAYQASAHYSGLGFMLANGYFGIDIDDVADAIKDYKAGGHDNIIAEFIYSLESYAEYSQSGKGLHIICKGTLPDGGRRKGNVEMYSQGRYFIMTGNIAAAYTTITDCTETIRPLHAKYITAPAPPAAAASLSDSQLFALIRRSKQSAAFNALYQGLWRGSYPSQSEADLALCQMLAFWLDKDKPRIDSLFRQSGLYRDKWDRPTGKTTYGNLTLDKAIALCQHTYSPHAHSAQEALPPTTPAPRRYSYDDTGNARRFADRFHDIIRYSHHHRQWFIYTGKRWQADQTGAIKRLADSLIQEMPADYAWTTSADEEKALAKHITYTRKSPNKQAMLKEAQHLCSILPSQFDQDPFLLNVQNGTIDLRTGQLMPHDAKKYHAKICSVDYLPQATCPLWQEFLQTIFNGNKPLIRYIQKIAGIFLTGNTQEQALYFLYGNGCNGKSTFLNALYDILGDYAITAQPETFMLSHTYNSTKEYELARMPNTRLVVAAETTDGGKLNESLIKQMTGGEEITCRMPYGIPFSFRPQYKICITTNHKPIIRGHDDGIWRRIHIIPFNNRIPPDKIDKTLGDKLQAEYPAILAWAVQGCLLWQQEGIQIPPAIQRALSEYQKDMDILATFLADCTQPTPNSQISAVKLYQTYLTWARQNNEPPVSRTKFGSEISTRFPKKRKSDGIYYQNLRLTLPNSTTM